MIVDVILHQLAELRSLIMAHTIASFDPGHGDTVHDVQLDYYGRRLATASSDRTIKVFDIVGDQVSIPLLSEL